MEQSKSKVEVSLRESKIYSFLNDLMELCSKHHVTIITDEVDTIVEFHNWDYFSKLEADPEGASLYWPRIQTDIVVRRKNEKHSKVVPDAKETSQAR